MPALKEKSTALLGTIAAADMHTGAGVTIFTVPPAKFARITEIVVFNPSASLAAATAVNFGSFFNGAANNNLSTVTAATHYWVLQASGLGVEATAGQAIQVVCASGANASASINVFGFLGDA